MGSSWVFRALGPYLYPSVGAVIWGDGWPPPRLTSWCWAYLHSSLRQRAAHAKTDRLRTSFSHWM